jgi:cytochrome c
VNVRTRNVLAILATVFVLAACDEQSTTVVVDEALYAQGKIAFQRLCTTCHDGRDKVGPDLAGLMGRRAGSVSGFDYSPAMRAFDIKWDADALDAFLIDPPATIPGTKMVVEPVDDLDERTAVIYYLTQR